MTKELYSGAEIILKSLVKEGVTEIFGYPGGQVIKIYDALYNQNEIKHYLVRHEQAAIHAAEGYSRATGKCGVALVTSGPGACNTITGIANAYYDGYPIVVLTGQVGLSQIGNDAFQEADIVGITRSCCKHNYLVKDIKDIPRVIKEAFHIATTGKPGPVVIDLPKDVQTAKSTFEYPESIKLVGYNPNYKGHPLQIAKAVKMLTEAHRPVIISGGGVLMSGAHEELQKLNSGACNPHPYGNRNLS
jgi:acetolactate synthase-1/2/3 large subunit